MTNPTPDGWITYQKIRLHDGRTIVVQKKDGSTRTFVQPRPVSHQRKVTS